MHTKTVRESGEYRPDPTENFDGTTRHGALAELLLVDKMERALQAQGATTITGRFRRDGIPEQRITYPAANRMVQENAAHAFWAKHFPGKPAHFECDASDIEARIFRRMLPWRARLRLWVTGSLAVLLVAANANAQQMTYTAPAVKPTPQQAADIMRRLERPALPQGPTVVIVPSTPGALTWLAFPPPAPARRLDGTLLSSPVTVYGQTYHHHR